MSALLKKSWKDLSRRRARTIFTIITVALGVMGIGLFAITPLADGAVRAELSAEQMHNIGVRVTDVPLSVKQLADLRSLDNVDQMSPQAELLVTLEIGSRRVRALLVGIPDYTRQAVDVVRITSGEVPEGMQVLTDQGNEANAVIALSEGDGITVQGPTGTTDRLIVTGVGKNSIHSAATRGGVAVFYTSLDAIEQISGRTGYTNLDFTVKDTDPAAMARTVEVIRDYLVANTSVVAFDDLADVREAGFWEGREIFSQIMSYMAILALMILFVSLFLIANTMNTIVSEQTREIAMMKAIGATRGTVFRSFLTTSALIGLIGAGIGAGLGILVASLVEGTLMKQSFGFDAGFDVDWPTVGISLAVGVGVVVLASLPALVRTLRVSVVEGLEGHGISADFGRTLLDRGLMRIRGMPRVVQMGIRNAARRKGRSISTILQVAFAVAVVIAMLNGADGLIDMTVRAYDPWTWDLRATVADDPSDPLTVEKAALIEGIEGVTSVEPVYRTVAKVNDRTVSFYGYVQDTGALGHAATLEQNGQGRWWTPGEATAAERVVVIGGALSRFEDVALGDTVGLMTATGAHEFEVIGIDDALPENGLFAYAPLEAVQAILQKGDGINGFFIRTASGEHEQIDATSRRISDGLEAMGYQADVTVKYVAAEQNVAQNQALTGMFLMMSFIVVLIVLIGLMSTLVMNILDRTREIGMLRCIGAQSRDVRRLFASEGLFLAFLGWIVGLPLGYAVYQVYVAAMAIGMKLTMPDRYALIYVGLSLVFTLVGTLIVIFFPLRRATDMKPGDAIRYQ